MTDFPRPDDGSLEQVLRRDLRETVDHIPAVPVDAVLVRDTRRLGHALRTHRTTMTLLVVAAVALTVLAILVSPALGRAEPTGRYRPQLPADPLELGCYPLPPGLTLDFPYQVRKDGDVDGVRVLTLHWDELDAAEVRRRLAAALVGAGLPRRSATVTPFPELTPDMIVRGEVVLRLPVARLSSADPACTDPATTKRFPDDWAPSTEYG
ncbi:hypothetical protein [Nocardioides antri]|uniref:Uncharacterized protein n=1 Tax=Nocardioides antri TaxID=2607659 RepID=A0A5B1M4Y1_9ACTN|nr:hypothetical protein [Nocardioides antri]KAA1427774.1 hypothetical protein F0U47_10120 [Nocardioides antri]